MPIVNLSDFASSSNGDGANGKDMPPHGPGGIYHEKQIGSLCALHAVNNMLQGPLFDEFSFRTVAQQLDQAERRLTGGEGLDYGNARADGFFNVQVVQAVLNQAGYEMQPVQGEAVRNAKVDTAKEIAFILNKQEHWFSLRRIGREWFDLNSCLCTPRHYSDADLRFHIRDAVREGYMVFVVQGDFPRCALEENPKSLVEAVQGCGRPGQGYSLFAGEGNRLDSNGAVSSHGNPVSVAGPSDMNALRQARLARFSGSAAAPQAIVESAPNPAPASASTPALVPTPAPALASMVAPTHVSQALATSVGEEQLQMLVAMGFPRDRVQCALEAAAGNTEMATELLLAF